MQTPRTVLVTGGNRGIGFAIAEEFIAAGHRVAVTARSGSGPKGSLSVIADVTDPDVIRKILDHVHSRAPPRLPPRRAESHQTPPDLFAER